MENITLENLDFNSLPSAPAYEPGLYQVSIEIKGTNKTLQVSLGSTDNTTFDAGDYYTAPSIDGEIEFEIYGIEVYDWDTGIMLIHDDNEFLLLLKEKIKDHYN